MFGFMKALRRRVAVWAAWEVMAQLEMLHVRMLVARQWLAEFPDAADALDYAMGDAATSLDDLSAAMRVRRWSSLAGDDDKMNRALAFPPIDAGALPSPAGTAGDPAVWRSARTGDPLHA